MFVLCEPLVAVIVNVALAGGGGAGLLLPQALMPTTATTAIAKSNSTLLARSLFSQNNAAMSTA
jgi:hypothetical protein